MELAPQVELELVSAARLEAAVADADCICHPVRLHTVDIDLVPQIDLAVAVEMVAVELEARMVVVRQDIVELL